MSLLTQPMSFGALLRELRLQHGWTQEQVGRFAGITTNQVSNLEREVCVLPNVDTVARLAKAFGVDPEELDPRILAERVEQEALTFVRRQAIKTILNLSDRDVAAGMARMDAAKRPKRRGSRR